MKKIISSAFLFCLVGVILIENTYSQQAKQVKFLDESNAPIEDVMVFHNGYFVGITDEKGLIKINNDLDAIYCHRMGFKDTIAELKKLKDHSIVLSRSNDIKGVTVSGKYNARKHLIRLRNQSKEMYKNTDTTIFYRFEIQFEIPDSNQKEVFSGILKVPYYGNHELLYYQTAYFCHLDNYENTFTDSNYALTPKNLIRMLINSCIILKDMYEWDFCSSKKNKFSNLYQSQDSILFLSSNEKNNYYISFKNGHIHSVESIYYSGKPANTRKNELYIYNNLSYFIYSMIDKNIYPSFLSMTRRYKSQEGMNIVCYLTLTETDECLCELDSLDNEVSIGKNYKEACEYIEIQKQNQNNPTLMEVQ